MTISKVSIGFAALLLLGGVAVAQEPNTGPVSDQMVLPKHMPMGGGGSQLGSAQLFAVVNGATGAVARGKGEAAGSQRVVAGQYRVPFSRDISKCSYTATVGGVGSEVATGFASTNGASGNNTTVIVRTFSPAGVQADRSFHLYVDC